MRDQNHLMAELLLDDMADRFYGRERRRVERDFYRIANKKGEKPPKAKGGYAKRLQARFAQKRKEK